MSSLKSVARKISKHGESLSHQEAQRYSALIRTVTSDPLFCKSLDSAIEGRDVDRIVKPLLSLSVSVASTSFLLRELITYDVIKYQLEHEKLLRVFVAVKGVSTELVRMCALMGSREFLKAKFGPFVEQLMGESKDLSNSDNLQLVSNYCEQFLGPFLQKETLSEIPSSVLQLFNLIATTCAQHDVSTEDFFPKLVSQFMADHFYGAVLQKPKELKLVQEKPKQLQAANLSFFHSSVLLQIATGSTYSSDHSLAFLNPVIVEHMKPWNEHVTQVVGRALSDECRMEVTAPRYELICEHPFMKSNFHILAHCFLEYASEIVKSIQFEIVSNKMRLHQGDDITRLVFQFITILEQLYDKDITLDIDIIEGPELKPNQAVHTSFREGFPSFVEIEKELKLRMVQNFLFGQVGPKSRECSIKLDISDLVDSRFLFLGKPSKSNTNVVYLITHRIPNQIAKQADKFLAHIYRVLKDVTTNYFQLIIDASFMELGDEDIGHLAKILFAYFSFSDPDVLKFCLAIYVLHPTFKSQQLIDEFLFMAPKEDRTRLVRYVHQWPDLLQVIDLEHLWIPFLTKRFIPVTYHVIKDTNGKRREVLVKITNDSLLIIDYQTSKVQTEILLRNIEEIRTKVNDKNLLYEVFMQYMVETDGEIEARRGTYFFEGKQESQKDKINTLYLLCFTEAQLQNIVTEVFETGIRALGTTSGFSSFLVDKIRKSGKSEKRMFKMTYDSIFHFKDKTIRSEIPYSTIASIQFEGPDVLIFYNKKDKVKRVVIRSEKEVKELNAALLNALEQYKFVIAVEREIAHNRNYDFVLERFFSNSLMNADSDNVYKTVLRIDTPFQNLMKLFTKCSPDSEGKITFEYHSMTKLVDGTKAVGLTMTIPELQHVATTLDRKEKGYLTLEDFVRGIYYVYRAKATLERRNKQLSQVQLPK